MGLKATVEEPVDELLDHFGLRFGEVNSASLSLLELLMRIKRFGEPRRGFGQERARWSL